MSLININQTSFDHTFQSNVTFLSSSFFQSNAIVASDAKLEVNGTSTFIGASDFSSAAIFKDTVSVNSSITGESLEISSSSTLNNININGKLFDGDGDFGTAGQLLSSDGTDLEWIDASSTSVANANNVGTNANSTNADQFITFVSASSGNNPIRVDTDLTYNPSTNIISSKISDISNHDTDDLSEGSTNLYYTNARADTRADARIAAADTDDLSEGSTNLYHTTARARSSISAGGDLSYNSSTGVMSISVPSAFVSGMIILWSGSEGSIPSGFVLCNGSNNTPDLRNRFVIGAGGSYDVGDTGGSANATLVSHSHTTNSTINEGNSNTKSLTGSFRNEPHDTNATSGIFSETTASFREDSDQGNNGRVISIDATHRHTTNTQGSSASNANLPPYYALCYIMKT